jgi:hypothetical protein
VGCALSGETLALGEEARKWIVLRVEYKPAPLKSEGCGTRKTSRLRTTLRNRGWGTRSRTRLADLKSGHYTDGVTIQALVV